jgi:hypothetical protein
MARDNQGLQIALIVFVALALLLGVSTFIFYSRYDESKQNCAKAEADAKALRTEAEQWKNCNVEKNKKIGVGANDPEDAIEKQFIDDMEAFWPKGTDDPKEGNRNYRALLARLGTELQKKEGTITDSAKSLEDARTAVKNSESKYKEAVKKWEAANQTVVAELAREHETAAKSVEAVTTSRRTDLTTFETGIKKLNNQNEVLSTSVSKATSAVHEKETQVRDLRGVINKLAKNESPDTPSGKIDYVSQGEGKVWINLGRADSLNRLITFSVYSGDTADLGRAQKKASIEVVDILGDHSAVARIVDDKSSDPIVRGDVIHTPIWTPGEHLHVALAGRIELDDSGNNDMDKALTLMRMNGAVVDCWDDAKAKEVKGKITATTRYLVLGKAPDAKSDPAEVRTYTEIQKAANKYQTKTLTLKELLREMGWKAPTQLVRYGVGANPVSTYAKPDSDLKSPGSATPPAPAFKPRTPQTSAY